MPKPKQCPKCHSEKVMYIQYGYPIEGYKYPKNTILGGCIISGHDPKWHCGNCHWQWGPGVEGFYYKNEDTD